jgi:hypothetical protein
MKFSQEEEELFETLYFNVKYVKKTNLYAFWVLFYQNE